MAGVLGSHRIVGGDLVSFCTVSIKLKKEYILGNEAVSFMQFMRVNLSVQLMECHKLCALFLDKVVCACVQREGKTQSFKTKGKSE